MRLTDEDKKLLKEWGYPKSDLNQIEVATSITKYLYTPKGKKKEKIVCDVTARELLGDQEYLSGISRSAFHRTSSRETLDGGTIFFDTSALFSD